MNRTTFAFALLVVLASTSRAQDPTPPDFNTHVAPILQKYCVGCHGGGEAEGGLVLESYETLMAGGKRGQALLPGKADQSRLILLLEGKATPAMPPEGNEAPTVDEIALLRAWIDAGARSPTGAAPDPTRLVTPRVPLLAPARHPLNAVAWSPDGRLLALAGYRRVRLIAADSHALVLDLADHRGSVTAVSFSADGTKLVTAAGEAGLFGEARVYNVADGALLRTIVGHRDALYAVALSPDGALLATAGYDEQIVLWSVESGSEVMTIEGHHGAVYDLAFRCDGRVLASASADRTVKLWDVATGARLETLGQSLKELYAVAFSPDGTRLAAAGVDNRIRVWQISETASEGSNPILYSRFAHQEPVIEIAWSPDGQSLVSAGEGRNIKLWTAATMDERLLLELQPDWTHALAFSPDSAKVLVGRLDGTYALYDAASGAVVPVPAPELAGIWPRGAQRGAAGKIKLTGANLANITAVTFGDSRIAATMLPPTPGTANEAWIEVTAGADVPRGAYDLSVTTAGGTTAAVKLYVDDLPQEAEAEQNGSPQTATAVALPAGIWGALDAQGDVDHYAFETAAGETLVFDLAAAPLGSKANAVLTLFDPHGRVVASGNDFDGQPDPLLTYTVPEAGRYVVAVSEQALGASAEHYYRLSLGAFPFVTGCYPLSVPANQPARVELVGYNLPPDRAVELAASAGGEVAVPVDPQRFRFRRDLRVVVGSLPENLEAEPNDEVEQATTIAVPGVAGGRIVPAGSAADADLFRFESRAGQQWIIETDAARRGSPIDTKIEVLDAAGGPLVRVQLQAIRDSYLTFRGIDSNAVDARLRNWEEMGLNELVYMQGEVGKIFRMPQGPDSGVNYYGWAGRRICYFDTSPTTHAIDEPCYIVEPHPPGAELTPTGLPIFPVYYANDDDGERKLGSDSKLLFTAPADGAYLVRVSDVRGESGDRYAYRLIVREPRPDFVVTLGGDNPTVNAGSGRDIGLSLERLDGFDGDVVVDIAGLPPGFAVSSPVVIQAGHFAAKAVVYAAADAPSPTEENAAQTVVRATANVAGQPVVKEVHNLGRIALGEAPKLRVTLTADPAASGPGGEILIRPGTTIPAILRVERNGFDDRITFTVENLPHGVIVDDIGLNGVLIPEGMNERRIFLSAAPWVTGLTRQIHAVAAAEGNQASPAVVLQVAAPAEVAAGGN